ncbi:putative inner-membrane translocator [Treponema primitia ZAS-2]|uniref:Putative inner-membrane translocator n=1 Tax=Treponema primitia (strain ATCC BAA-887 / DSM 12427 / ZAS-2) TaxID=545694 RepID=F5YM63_TREPZ|nr:branched-chain amino acid ABC transporter permease [Treponema primitia]AEF85243.1 putative inner-membrane translocator [Treponema primitia ZAS-2]
MEILIAQIINGLSLGSIYVLLVTAFNLLLLVARVIHFSFPAIIVFSMYMAWFALQATGSIIAGIGASIVSAIILNMVSAPVFQHIMRGELRCKSRKRGTVDINATMVISMGMGVIITEFCSHSINKGFPVSFLTEDADPSGWIALTREPLWQHGLISVSYGQALSLAVGIIAVAVLFRIIYRTRVGRAFRAMAENPGGAKLAGIPVFRTGLQSYFLTGLLGGITAALMAMLLGFASADLGDQLGHKVLGISIIAGLGNLAGGLVFALLLGIVEALIQGYFSGSWSNAAVFVIMLVVVLAKPKGVFGTKL